MTRMLMWLSLSTGKYYYWLNARASAVRREVVPKSHYLLPWERQAIVDYRLAYPEEGYRRLTFRMLDEDVVAVSPSSVYRVLRDAGLLNQQWRHAKARGSGFVQPSRPHQHWHLDISYINFKGTFVYLVVLIDGYSRYIVHWELRMSVEALDVEILLERALEKFPGERPVLITDNGPQFISREFKGYLEFAGITHRRTRFYYPQSNGKVERFMQTAKNESVRRRTALDLDELSQQIAEFIEYYNTERLHSSLGYITPTDMLIGRQDEIFKERQGKLHEARLNRERAHRCAHAGSVPSAVLTAQNAERGTKSRPSAPFARAEGLP